MSEEHSGRFRFAVILILSVIIVTGAVIAVSRYEPGNDIVIVPKETIGSNMSVYIGGSVNLPGYYPCDTHDSIESLIRAAGGLSANGSISDVLLTIADDTPADDSQKIDINRAESWLLESLPGIGKTLAERIVTHRNENGRFNTILELKQVDGIGPVLFDAIAPYITVSE